MSHLLYKSCGLFTSVKIINIFWMVGVGLFIACLQALFWGLCVSNKAAKSKQRSHEGFREMGPAHNSQLHCSRANPKRGPVSRLEFSKQFIYFYLVSLKLILLF